MKITLCERDLEVEPGTTLFALRDRVKPEADILVLNGGPVETDCPLSDGDSVVLIRRGEVPGPDELEALIATRHTPGVHDVVKRSTVGIAGLGGLGSSIAIALARTGLGRLVLADFDVVEPSNLNRQQYFVDQMGMLKVVALGENLKRINPYVNLELHPVLLTPENLSALFGEVDVMVEAFDSAEAKAMIAEVFSKSFPEKPLVMASGVAGFEPSNTIQTRKIGRNIVLVGDLVNAAGQGRGLMAPRVGVAAHHQANAVLRLLLGKEC